MEKGHVEIKKAGQHFPEDAIRERILILFRERMYAFHPSVIDAIVKIIKEEIK